MANTANTPAGVERLSDRPGWAELRLAVEELHAAELLLQDPVATTRTALPHLHAFWAAVASAGQAYAGSSEAKPDPKPDPKTWLAGDVAIPGLSPQQRQTLREHLQNLASASAEEGPTESALLVHVRDARALVAALEPELGGMPLRRRRRRTLIGAVGALLLLGPLFAYTFVQTELPGTGPWRAAYYPDRKLESEPSVVREDSVDHDWDDRPPLEEIPPDKFSARWDTCIVIGGAVDGIFQINANDGARLFVDGELVIDAWERNPSTRRRGFGSGSIALEAGIHHVQVEYFESLGKQSIRLVASLDGGVPHAISRDILRYPGDVLNEDDPCGHVSE